MNAVFELVVEFLESSISLGGNPLGVTWGGLIFRFVLPLVGIVVLVRIIVFFVRRLLKRGQLKDKTQEGIMRWVRLVSRLLLLLAIVLLGANLLGDRISESMASIFGFLGEPFYTSGNTSISVVTLLLLIPIFYIATWAGNATRRFLEQGILDRINLDRARQFSIVNMSRYAVIALVVLIGLSIVGVNLSSLAVLFGVLGIGVGFGLQGVVANFFAGLMIILSSPIKEGDRIHINDLEGDVVQIRILYSVVNTITQETLIIPNREIVENVVHNQSYDDPGIVLFTDVQVAYGTDLERAREVLMGVGEQAAHLKAGETPRVLYRSFDDSGITVTLAIPIRTAVDRHIARSETMIAISRAFRANGITIPFPQMDLHVKGQQSMYVTEVESERGESAASESGDGASDGEPTVS